MTLNGATQPSRSFLIQNDCCAKAEPFDNGAELMEYGGQTSCRKAVAT